MKADVSIQTDVAAELDSDPRIDSSRIRTGVHDAIATLTGTVPSYWQKIEAEEVARRIRGVRAVANELTVELASEHVRDDTDIASAAAQALAWHSDLPDTIKVTASNGWIMLSGKADWQYQKQEAEFAVKYLMGVRGVMNDIELKPRPKVADVRERIKNELERTVDQEANQITIETSDGSVTLRGTVHSWTDDEAARRAAWSVPGVTSVEDRLAVSGV